MITGYKCFDFTNNIAICRGITIEHEYDEYYNLYAVSELEILKKLEHNEIINYALN